jgi:hypothetical protein
MSVLMDAPPRVLTTLLLLQAGYAYVPYSSLESVIEQSKESYYLALRQTQGTIRAEAPNWQPWLVFFLRSLADQVRRLEKKVEREKIVLAVMPQLQLQIDVDRLVRRGSGVRRQRCRTQRHPHRQPDRNGSAAPARNTQGWPCQLPAVRVTADDAALHH